MPVTGAGIPITTLRMVLIALRACRLSEAVFVYDNTSHVVNRKSGDSAQRCRVSRNGAPQAGRRKGDGRRAGACRCRSLFPRRPSPPVPSGGPRHSTANAVSGGIPCILGRTSPWRTATALLWPPARAGSAGPCRGTARCSN